MLPDAAGRHEHLPILPGPYEPSQPGSQIQYFVHRFIWNNIAFERWNPSIQQIAFGEQNNGPSAWQLIDF